MASSGTETILVVDDETIILTLTQAMLARFGYTVLGAQNATEALHFFEVFPEQHVDLALIDIVLPGIDGFELAERLRLIRPALPILYTSAYSSRLELRPERSRGAPFIAKPFSSVTLTRKIREMLDVPQSSHASAST
jgi:two-component system, cell cycle sensor histidine kinase and response regulator CckA